MNNVLLLVSKTNPDFHQLSFIQNIIIVFLVKHYQTLSPQIISKQFTYINYTNPPNKTQIVISLIVYLAIVPPLQTACLKLILDIIAEIKRNKCEVKIRGICLTSFVIPFIQDIAIYLIKKKKSVSSAKGKQYFGYKGLSVTFWRFGEI